MQFRVTVDVHPEGSLGITSDLGAARGEKGVDRYEGWVGVVLVLAGADMEGIRPSLHFGGGRVPAVVNVGEQGEEAVVGGAIQGRVGCEAGKLEGDVLDPVLRGLWDAEAFQR